MKAGVRVLSRRVPHLAVAGAVASAVLTLPAPLSAPDAWAAGPGELSIQTQVFDLGLGGRFDATFALPPGLSTADLGADTVLTVVSHARLDDREAFLNALDGSLGDEDDVLTIPLDPSTLDPSIVSYPSTTSMTVSVPTVMSLQFDEGKADPANGAEPGTPPGTTPGAAPGTTPGTAPVIADSPLVFSQSGVHPIDVRLARGGHAIADVTTFVRVRDPAAPIDAMSVAMVMGQTTQPTIATDGSGTLTPDDIDELDQLADTLEGIDGAAAATGSPEVQVPRAVFVQPATLQALAVSDPELAARLTAGLMRSEVVAAPRLPFEPSAAAAAGQADRYTELLSDGEDLLGQLLPGTDIDRSLHIVREPFTTGAAQLLRKNVGARMMLMGFDLYRRASGGNGNFTDTSQLVSIALPDQSEALTALVDPHIGPRIDEGADEPMLTAIQVVADLVVTAQGIDEDGGVVSRHGMLVARSDLGVPDAALMTDLAGLLTSTPGLRLVTPGSLATSVDVLLRPGGSGEVAVTMPTQAYVDLGDRVALIDDVSEEIFAFASLLPDDTPQVDGWLKVLDALPSTAMDDADAGAMVANVRSSFDAYRHAVQGPPPFTFTFTSRSNTLTFSLTNTTSTKLHVRVRLSSPKLTFPEGDIVRDLEPGDNEVQVPVRALSNGRSSVFLRVYTPAENSDIQVMPEVVLTAQVRSLAGLGQLLTGAFLLLLLAWWGRHWQQTRRKRAAAGNVDRHPANGRGQTEPGHGAAGDDLAPDAAASSLPPS